MNSTKSTAPAGKYEEELVATNLGLRRSLQKCRRVVIKIGTSSLTNSQGTLDHERISKFTRSIAYLHKILNKELLLVTSGAIGAGVSALGFKKRPKKLPELQMAAAIGQSRLMSVYSENFARENLLCAQILLTHEDLKVRSRHVNAVNTFEALIRHGVIPVINENDVVAVDEIKVGDNDSLAAMVAIMSKSDLLILLTTTDGLRDLSREGSPRIPFINRISSKTISLARGKTNQFSTGGMHTKLLACKNAAAAGIPSLILDSSNPASIKDALEGADLGTLVGLPGKSIKIQSRKRYVGFFQDSKGTLYLDDGAATKISCGNSSLLAVGISGVSGNFKNGAVVTLKTASGTEIGRGVSSFSSAEIRKFRGKRSSEIDLKNNKTGKSTVVHKDKMILI